MDILAAGCLAPEQVVAFLEFEDTNRAVAFDWFPDSWMGLLFDICLAKSVSSTPLQNPRGGAHTE